MRSTVRRARASVLMAVVALFVAGPLPAGAAQISIDAPASCLDPAALTDEVSSLVGKPLGSVADVDFRVSIVERPQRRWRLRLETLDSRTGTGGPPAVLGSREIEGASCAELAEAAAVAIAVAVRSIDQAAAPAPAVTAPPPTKAAVAPPAALPLAVAGPAPAPSWRPALALAFATDSGALPNIGLGIDLEGHLQRGPLRLVALATWFGSEEVTAATNGGGTFDLMLGGLLACWDPRPGRWAPLACGGLELGRLSGKGLGVAHPETGDAFWRAARADLGLALGLGGKAALLLRAGLVRPLARPQFVLDESQPVYRPSNLTVRVTAGLQLGF